MNKAWKMIRFLERSHPWIGMDPATLLDWLSTFDDRDWDNLRRAAGIKASELHGREATVGGTSCTVSRQTKVKIYGILAGDGNARPVGLGQDALGGRVRRAG